MAERTGSGVLFVAIGAVVGLVMAASFLFAPQVPHTADAVAQLSAAYANVIPPAAL